MPIFILVLTSCSREVHSGFNESILCDYNLTLPTPYTQYHAELRREFRASMEKEITSLKTPHMTKSINELKTLSDQRDSPINIQPTVSDYLLGKDVDDCHSYILQELHNRNIPDDEVDLFFEALYADNNIDQDAKYRCRCPRNGNHVDKIKG